MNNTVSNTTKHSPTNKWDVLLDLQKRIETASSTLAFCEDKIKTSRPFLGDPTAELAAAKNKLQELKEMYSAVLSAPTTHI